MVQKSGCWLAARLRKATFSIKARSIPREERIPTQYA